MTRPAFVRQPGPTPADRIACVAGRGTALTLALEPGPSLSAAIAEAFRRHGFTSGTINLAGMALAPFAYVMPALATTTPHAAYYSETFRPAGVTQVDAGALTFGPRDGRPFYHFHALWTEADGRRRGGHVLPDETGLAEPCVAEAFGFAGGGFESVEDPETMFRLFEPRGGSGTVHGSSRAFALRMRPNQDFCGALEAFCQRHGLRAATIRGGVGSTIGARFTDGRTVENFATEVFVRSGAIRPGPDGALEAVVDVGLVDYTGAMAEGVLERGANPVLMTFELILEETDRP